LCTSVFHLLPRPPTSPLFPYTTLFRSVDRAFALEDVEGSIAHATMLGDTRLISAEESAALVGGLNAIRAEIESGTFPWDARLEEDRKSTRLNSSHRTISYAVFCLKKKI